MGMILFYWAALASCCGYALLWGRGDERFAAAACIVASLLTRLLISPVGDRYEGLEEGILLVDMLTLAAFVALALKSNRFWPLWIAGLQLTTSMAHILKLVDNGLMPYAYAAAGRVWSYPILIIIAIGTYRSRHHFQSDPPARAA